MREQIGPGELSALIYGFLVGTSLIVPPGVQAQQASWLAVLLGGTAGLALAWIYTSLAIRFPDQSLIGYSKQVLGKWLGGLAGLLYIWYSIHLGALVLRNFGEFLVVSILPATPLSVPILALGLLGAYGARHGATVVGRAAQVINTVVTIQVFVLSLLLFREMRLERLLPVLDAGLMPLLTGSFAALQFPFGETVLFALLLPLARPVGQVRRTVMFTLIAGTLFLSMVHARNMAVLGPHLAATERFPTFGAIQSIDVADFLNRLDAVVVGNWVATGFIKVVICQLAASRGIADWAGLREYRPLVLPIFIITSALAMILNENASEMAAFARVVGPTYKIPFHILIPLMLLGVAKVRRLRAQ